MAEDFGWLIETGDHKYWNGKRADADGFTHDPNDAVRFARFEDGERVIYHLMQLYSVFLVTRQHKWVDGDPKRRDRRQSVEGCSYCDAERVKGNKHFPPHDASPSCESGNHNHCTCDTCF